MLKSKFNKKVLDKVAREDKPIHALIKQKKEKMDKLKICPRCETKMTLGSFSWKEVQYGCYDNKLCSFREETGFAYNIDLSFEYREIEKLNDLLKDRKYVRLSTAETSRLQALEIIEEQLELARSALIKVEVGSHSEMICSTLVTAYEDLKKRLGGDE